MGSVVFSLTHDAVDLSEYSSTVGADITAAAGAALCSTSGGMNVLIDDTAEQYGRKDFTAGGEFRTRFYIDPNGVTITAGAMRILWWKNAAGTTKYQCYLQMSGSDYAVRLYAYTDGGSNTTVATGTLTDDGTNAVLAHFSIENRFNETTTTSMAAGVITAAAIATGAIDADALAADAVDEIWDEVAESTYTVRQLLRAFLAALANRTTGGGTGTCNFRDVGNTKNRIVATVDSSGNRTGVTLDLT